MNPTSEQLEAVEANDHLILVRAGAGTGKTEVLTRRVVRLLKDDPQLSIQQIAIITFTNKATENLMSRLKNYLYTQWKFSNTSVEKKRFRYELENLNSSQVSTIHKFCKYVLDLVGPIHYDDFDYAPSFNVSESSINRATELTLEEWIKEKESNQLRIHHEDIMPIHNLKDILLGMYHLLRSQGIPIEKAIETSQKSYLLETGNSRILKIELLELLEKLYKNHRQLRLQSLDPDNLLEYCFKVLRRNPDVSSHLKNTYKYLFVDEFQDTSMYQTGIIKEICDGTPDSPKLFVVGDSKQSIYQFRGADLNSYSSVEKWIQKNGKILKLSTNFRSTGELVFYVNLLFERIKLTNPDLHFQPEPLKTTRVLKEPIALNEAFTWLYEEKEKTQAQVVAEYIKKELERGIDAKKFAILFRKNYPMLEFAEALKKLEIPYQLVGAGNYFNQREIIDTFKIINLLLQPHSSLNREEAIETIYFKTDIERVDPFLESVIGELQHRSPAQILELIYQNTQIRERLINTSPQAVANLNKLKELVRNLSKKESIQLGAMQTWLAAMIASHKEEQQSDIPASDNINAVTLITIHKAKGLEYPIVILPNLQEKVSKNILMPNIIYNKQTGIEFKYTPYFQEKSIDIPSDNYMSSIKEYDLDLYSEELRVLYVALTRAEEHLVLVGSQECKKNDICFQNWLQVI
ncbi:UvrD-helicase domain-containing protein [Paenibacillus elgii]